MSAERERGAALLREGRATDAVAALRAATELDSRDVMAWRLLGGALAQSANPDAALAAFEEACNLQPEAAKNHYNAALTLQTLGRTEEAKRRFERALALDPGYEQARLRLAELGGAPLSSAPPPLTPPVPSPPFQTVGGGTDATPPPPGTDYPTPSAYRPAPVNATTPLVLSILGLVVCQILSPVAWIMAHGSLGQLDANPQWDQSARGTVTAAKILGIIGTVLAILGILAFVTLTVIGALVPDAKGK